MTDLQRLPLAVLMFHRGGQWTETDRRAWRDLTGEDEATTAALCRLAQRAMAGQFPDELSLPRRIRNHVGFWLRMPGLIVLALAERRANQRRIDRARHD